MTVPLPSGAYRVVCLTADLTSDGSGNATAAFVPALGEIPTLAATVETKDPFLPLALVNPEQGFGLSLIHISEPTRPCGTSRMPSSA